nr:hypothetical protein [Natronococcus pandeyae]
MLESELLREGCLPSSGRSIQNDRFSGLQCDFRVPIYFVWNENCFWSIVVPRDNETLEILGSEIGLENGSANLSDPPLSVVECIKLLLPDEIVEYTFFGRILDCIYNPPWNLTENVQILLDIFERVTVL